MESMQRVKFHDTGNPEMDAMEGFIVGVAIDHKVFPNHYIVLVDKPHSSRPNDFAVQITEACLEVVPDIKLVNVKVYFKDESKPNSLEAKYLYTER